MKFRVLHDDVEGKEAGTSVGDVEKTLDVEGSRPAIFWITLPGKNFSNGRYKAEVTMFAENGQQKAQQTATFNVEGFSASKETDDASRTSQENNEPTEKTSAADTTENKGLSPHAADDFGNGSFRGFCRNKISGQRARLSFELTRAGNDISGSAFVGPPLRGSGVVTGQVSGDRIELWLETKDVRQKWTIHINGERTPGGGFEGSYTISDGQYGVFSVVRE